MPITWTIAIDWDRNNNFTGTYENVTSRVMQVNWFLGMRKQFRELADNSMLVIVLVLKQSLDGQATQLKTAAALPEG